MKEFFAVLTVLVTLAVAVPTFASIQEIKCHSCYGSGKCQTCRGTGKVVAYNWERNKKGKKVRVPPYYKACYMCFGKGRCKFCQGKGKVKVLTR